MEIDKLLFQQILIFLEYLPHKNEKKIHKLHLVGLMLNKLCMRSNQEFLI